VISIINGTVNIKQKYTGMNYTGSAADFLILSPLPIQIFNDARQEAGAKISKQVIARGTEVNQPVSVNQKSRSLTLNLAGQEAVAPTSFSLTLVLTAELKGLIQDSLSVGKQYRFLLRRTNAYTLMLTLISSKQAPRAEGRQLDALQEAMETCLKSANLEYECDSSGENEETLTVTGDKQVINALADLLVRQGLDMGLTEANKHSAFFKAERAERNRPNSEEESTFTCAMQ
jgi:hypothetical protein